MSFLWKIATLKVKQPGTEIISLYCALQNRNKEKPFMREMIKELFLFYRVNFSKNKFYQYIYAFL